MIEEYSKYALLAQASYSWFGSNPTIEQDLTEPGKGGLTASQASRFLDEYVLLEYQENTDSGFSASIFLSEGGEYIFAIRGTEVDLSGLLSDVGEADIADIGANGIAISQAIDLFNYYQQLTAVAGQQLVQYTYTDGIFGPGSIESRVEVADETGVLAGKSFTVVGHSLGGHLAMILGRLAGDMADAVYTYNAPGFDTEAIPGYNDTEWFFSELTEVQAQATGGVSSISGQFDEGKMINLVAPHDLISAIGTLPGKTLTVFDEYSNPVAAHSIVGVSDALALQVLFKKLDPSLGEGDFFAILEAGNSNSILSLESVLDALRVFLGGESVTPTTPEDRNSFYDNLFSIDNYLNESNPQGLKVVSLVGLNASDIFGLATASGGEIYRIALLELTPFVIKGLDYSSRPDLKIYDQATGLGNMTPEWLRDRAEFLHWKLELGLINGVTDPQVPLIDGNLPLRIEDRLSGLVVHLGAVGDVTNIVFGTDQADVIGAPNAPSSGHRFYGGGGNDALTGEKGQDYLEGGTGNDTLKGGQGSDLLNGGQNNDRYEFNDGDGFDRILDSSGQESIYINGQPSPTGKQLALNSNVWLSEDGLVRYTLIDAGSGRQDLLITYGTDDRILIEDYRSGAFGLMLSAYQGPAAETPPDPVTGLLTKHGDLKPIDTDPIQPGIQYGQDQWGNVLVDSQTPEPNRNDSLHDTDGNDELLGHGGDDYLWGGHGGHDKLVGGAGNDQLQAGAGNDTLEGGDDKDKLSGGAGNDLLNGGSGNDYLYGDAGKDTLQGGQGEDCLTAGSEDSTLEGGEDSDRLMGRAGDDRLYAADKLADEDFVATNTHSNGSAQRGDFLSSGAGQDIVVGAEREDLLMGGSGQDQLYGGAGNDVLYGDTHVDWSLAEWDFERKVELDEATQVTSYTVDFSALSAQVMAETGQDGDLLYGGVGDDWLFGEAGQDTMDGGANDDVLFGGRDNDVLLGGTGNDVLAGDNGVEPSGQDGADYLSGGTGNDRLQGDGGADILYGGDDDDNLSGDNGLLEASLHGDDYLNGERGNDKLWGDGGNDLLYGGEGNDQLSGDNGTLIGTEHGDDYLDGGSGNDSLFGDGGDDSLYGSEGNDQLSGDNDALDGEYHGDDSLDGGSGNDSLFGGGGSDALYGAEGDDALIGDSNGLMDAEYHGDDRLYGGSGNDSLWGGGEDDYLNGGRGLDYLSGGEGDDTYFFNLGDGALSAQGASESILDSQGSNILEFGAGITVEGVDLQLSSGMLNLHYSSGDSLLLADGFNGIHRVRFSDGTSLSLESLYGQFSQDQADQISTQTNANLVGSALSNQLTATSGGATFQGGRGDDTLSGGGGGNLYRYERGDGIDYIHDTGGHVLPDGTPVHNRIQFGTDISPQDVSVAPGSPNTLVVLIAGNPAGKLIIQNFNMDDVLNSCSIGYFDFADGSSLSTAQLLGSGFDLEGSDSGEQLFGGDLTDQLSGQAGDDTLTAGAGDDVLDGGAGNDWLIGGAGADIYLYARGDGADTLQETNDGNLNTLRFAEGLTPDDIEIAADASQNLVLTIKNSTDVLVLSNWFAAGAALIQRIEFFNGEVWTAEWILQNLVVQNGTDSNDVLGALAGQNATLYGLAGNDTLNGNNGNDLLVGGKNNDLLKGGSGNDRYLISLGDGQDIVQETAGIDTLEFIDGVSPSDITVQRVANDLVLSHTNGADKLTFRDWFAHADGRAWVEEIHFANGVVWSASTLTAQGLVQTGGDGNDTLRGVINFSDTLQGGLGDDELLGFGSDDLLDGGAGNDRIDGGSGNDTLYGGDGDDTIYGDDTVAGSTGNDVIYGGAGNDYILGRGGADIIYAEDGDDSVYAQNGDIIDAGRGNDTVTGDSGSSQQIDIIYASGYGYDVYDFAHIKFSEGFDSSSFEFLRSNDNLIMVSVADASDIIWINHYYPSWMSTASGKALRFSLDYSDGSQVLDVAETELSGVFLDARKITDDYTWQDVLYYSTNYSPDADKYGQYARLQGGGFFLGDSKLGDDVLIGSSYGDSFTVQSGNDAVYGLAGNDTFNILGGNDTICGGLGADSYNINASGSKTISYAVGDGGDYLRVSGSTPVPVVIKVSGYSSEDLSYIRIGSTIRLGFEGADFIDISDFLDIGNRAVASGYTGLAIEFDDGILSAQEILDAIVDGETSPIAAPDFFSVAEGQVLEISDSQLMQNDSDAEATAYYPLHFVGVTSATHGQAIYDANSGRILFVPDAGFSGVASFTYSISDYLKTSEGVVNIAVGKSYETLASTPLTLLSTDLLLGDSNPENNAHQVVGLGLASNGAAEFDPETGSIIFTPEAGFLGYTSFEYIVFDGVSTRTQTAHVLVGTTQNINTTGTSSADFIEGSFGNDTLNGSGGSDVLLGGKGNDRLNGGSSVDLMIGGLGNDTYVVDNVGDSVIEGLDSGIDTVESATSMTLVTNIENLLLTGSSAINGTGNELDNVLTGNSGANTLSGGAGNDRLDGKSGTDNMQGGLGNDTYVVERTADVVIEYADEGVDTIESSVTLTLGNNVENLTLTGTSALSGTGNALDNILIGNSGNNTLTGGAGNDRLNGGSGNDTMRGGVGNDTYVVNTTSDSIAENANEGTDTVESSVTLTLGNNVENLTLTGSGALNGTGNTLNNILTGNAGVNSLTGAAGNDRLDGQGAADTLTGGTGNDTYVLGRGYGTDTAVENDATAGNTDIAQFLDGIATDQLWFRKLSNNLEVSIIGTSDKLTVKDWYLGNAYHVEQFKTADGKTLLDSQVQNLVNAMAAFAPPAAGQTSLPENYQASLASVIATNWQ